MSPRPRGRHRKESFKLADVEVRGLQTTARRQCCITPPVEDRPTVRAALAPHVRALQVLVQSRGPSPFSLLGTQVIGDDGP